MFCAICKNGNTSKGFVTVTLQRNNTTVIIKGAPAEICDNCGEYFLDEKTTQKVMEMAERAALNNAEIEILSYAA